MVVLAIYDAHAEDVVKPGPETARVLVAARKGSAQECEL